MTFKLRFNWLGRTTKYLSLLVLLTTFCYSANVCAYQQPEFSANSGVTHDEKTERVTIELGKVSELGKVASFTQLLAKSPQLSDLQLTQVQLQVAQPDLSFVRWTAQLASGTPEGLELSIQTSAGTFEGLEVVHRQSYRGFIAFALHTVAQSEDKDRDFLPALPRSAWLIHSGQGFD